MKRGRYFRHKSKTDIIISGAYQKKQCRRYCSLSRAVIASAAMPGRPEKVNRMRQNRRLVSVNIDENAAIAALINWQKSINVNDKSVHIWKWQTHRKPSSPLISSGVASAGNIKAAIERLLALARAVKCALRPSYHVVSRRAYARNASAAKSISKADKHRRRRNMPVGRAS